MKAETPYIHLHQRKRTWTPVAVSAGTLLDGGEEVVQRALALRCLEIPVGDFISDAMKGDLPDVKGCKGLLESNVLDEQKHDLALDYAAEHIKSPFGLRKKLSALKTHGLNWTGIRSLRPWFLSVPSSLSYSQSFDSSETQDCELPQPTSVVTSRPTWLPTHLYAKRSVLNLTRPSTISDALRSRGYYSPSKGRVITNISQGTSGLQVQILSTHEAKQRG